MYYYKYLSWHRRLSINLDCAMNHQSLHTLNSNASPLHSYLYLVVHVVSASVIMNSDTTSTVTKLVSQNLPNQVVDNIKIHNPLWNSTESIDAGKIKKHNRMTSIYIRFLTQFSVPQNVPTPLCKLSSNTFILGQEVTQYVTSRTLLSKMEFCCIPIIV
jgi:hypothetical protein